MYKFFVLILLSFSFLLKVNAQLKTIVISEKLFYLNGGEGIILGTPPDSNDSIKYSYFIKNCDTNLIIVKGISQSYLNNRIEFYRREVFLDSDSIIHYDWIQDTIEIEYNKSLEDLIKLKYFNPYGVEIEKLEEVKIIWDRWE